MTTEGQLNKFESIHKYLSGQTYPRNPTDIARFVGTTRQTVVNILRHPSFAHEFTLTLDGGYSVTVANKSLPTVEVAKLATVVSEPAKPVVAKPTYVKGEIHWRPGKPDEELDPIIANTINYQKLVDYIKEKGWEPDYALKRIIGYLIRVHNEIVEAKSND